MRLASPSACIFVSANWRSFTNKKKNSFHFRLVHMVLRRLQRINSSYEGMHHFFFQLFFGIWGQSWNLPIPSVVSEVIYIRLYPKFSNELAENVIVTIFHRRKWVLGYGSTHHIRPNFAGSAVYANFSTKFPFWACLNFENSLHVPEFQVCANTSCINIHLPTFGVLMHVCTLCNHV